MPIPKRRKFNGKTFHFFSSHITKQDAIKSAKDFRKKGNSVRIIRMEGERLPYKIYIRAK